MTPAYAVGPFLLVEALYEDTQIEALLCMSVQQNWQLECCWPMASGDSAIK